MTFLADILVVYNDILSVSLELFQGVVPCKLGLISCSEVCSGQMLCSPFLFSLGSQTLHLYRISFKEILSHSILNLFSWLLSEKFISAFEWCLHKENGTSIIGMPLVFPWALGLRTSASLGTIPFVQMRSWSFCTADVFLGVQGSLPAQILSRMFSCQDPLVSCQHRLRGDILLTSQLCLSGWLFLEAVQPGGQVLLSFPPQMV